MMGAVFENLSNEEMCDLMCGTPRMSAESIKDHAEEIKTIIEDTEAIQDSNESDYTKEWSKIEAYDSIVELIRSDQ